jgi:hypothetical protein
MMMTGLTLPARWSSCCSMRMTLSSCQELSGDCKKQLDELGKFCDERDLTVNVKKTKVVVFGSRVNTNPLLYGGLPIKEVASFRYLGVELHRNGSMKTVVEHLVAAGKRVVFALRRRCADLKINYPAIICQLFDALVKPVISYACELWVN